METRSSAAAATATTSSTIAPNTTTTTKPPGPGGASVLFVCLGNICRSPMAEGGFREQTKFGTPQQHPLIARIDSCGTGAYHTGQQPDSRTLDVLRAHGIRSYEHGARRIRVPEDFLEFDYILAMDEDNEYDLRTMAERAVKKGQLRREDVEKVRLYGIFGASSSSAGGGGAREEVGDPYYGHRDGFTKAWEQVNRFGKGLLKHIESQSAE